MSSNDLSFDSKAESKDQSPTAQLPPLLTTQELKQLFAAHLRESDRLKRPAGLPTGMDALDQFLFWGGLPKGALSLLNGALGTGATSLWLEAAARVVRENRWVAWVNRHVPLAPFSLYHKGMDLNRFVCIEAPENDEKLFWLLQELMSSSLFELIGCDLGDSQLKEHQLRKLQNQARSSNAALVFLSQGTGAHLAANLRLRARTYTPRGASASIFSLIVNFEPKRILIERALHRPVPHSFSRSVSYARFTVHTTDRFSARSSVSSPEHALRATHSVPEAARASLSGFQA